MATIEFVEPMPNHEQALLWIEMKLPDDKELDWLGQTFALHPSTAKLVQSKADYPAFDWYAFLNKEEGHSLYPITASRIYFQQLNEHYQQTLELIHRNKDMLNIPLHQFQSRQADYLNTLVNRLTVVTIILSTAAVITGFYGINVGGLYPNTNNANGAWFVLALLVLLAIIQFVLPARYGGANPDVFPFSFIVHCTTPERQDSRYVGPDQRELDLSCRSIRQRR